MFGVNQGVRITANQRGHSLASIRTRFLLILDSWTHREEDKSEYGIPWGGICEPHEDFGNAFLLVTMDAVIAVLGMPISPCLLCRRLQ